MIRERKTRERDMSAVVGSAGSEFRKKKCRARVVLTGRESSEIGCRNGNSDS